MTELKPCPFCGSHGGKIYANVIWEDNDDSYFVIKCHRCGTNGPYADKKEKAMELWNRRANE